MLENVSVEELTEFLEWLMERGIDPRECNPIALCAAASGWVEAKRELDNGS